MDHYLTYGIKESRVAYNKDGSVLTLDNTTSVTENAVPFYALDNTYEFIVCSYDYIYNGPLKKLTWDEGTEPGARILLFKTIDYETNSGLPYAVKTNTQNLSPQETEKVMGYYYPKIEIIE